MRAVLQELVTTYPARIPTPLRFIERKPLPYSFNGTPVYNHTDYTGLRVNPFAVGDSVTWRVPHDEDDAKRIAEWIAKHGEGPYVVETVTNYEASRCYQGEYLGPQVGIGPKNEHGQRSQYHYEWFRLASEGTP